MRFSSIKISNYRQYRDLSLLFQEGEHDLQIIVGENGTGKTNLLNAFTWCLYGNEPHLGSNDKYKGEPILNKDAINETLEAGSSVNEIEICIEAELENEVAIIKRKLPVRVNSINEIIEKKPEESFVIQVIPKNGAARILKGEQAELYIEKRLPEGIREYFFFDGEQLSNYFSDNRSDAIRAAVQSISQIDVLSRICDRTETLVKEMRRGLRGIAPDLEKLESDLQRHEDNYRRAESSIQDYETQISEARDRIDELRERLRGVPDIEKLESKRDNLRLRSHEAARNVEDRKTDLILFARSSYIDFSFFEAAQKTLAVINGMEKEHLLPPSVDKAYLKEMLKEKRCMVCDRPLDDSDIKHIEIALERYKISSETSNILMSIRSELRNLIGRVKEYPSKREKILRSLKAAENELANITNELDDVENTFVNYPDSEKIKRWHTERSDLEKRVDDLLEKVGKAKTIASSSSNLAAKIQKDIENALRRVDAQNDIARAAEFGSRVVKTLKTVKESSIKETRTLMARKTEALFKDLVWKDSKCDHIELSDSYRLSLFDRSGYSCAGTCSAAERALLALSFTLAMHSVSGFDSPLFIDTPIARASGDNRSNFANTLAEVSRSKQLILTFTPDEYSESIASVFDPIAASNMKLVLDDEERNVMLRGKND